MNYKRKLLFNHNAGRRHINAAAADPDVDGVVLGDPFSRLECVEETERTVGLAVYAKEKNLWVCWHTPVYATESNFENVVKTARRLKGIVDEVRVQNLGVLSALKPIMPGVLFTWSIYGWQREFPGMDVPLNQGQVDFLKSRGVCSFEITVAVAFSIYEHRYPLNLNAQLYHGEYDPVSFSRLPYCISLVDETTGETPASRGIDCSRTYYLNREDGGGLKYVIKGHRMMEIPDPSESEELERSGWNFDALVVEL